MHFKVSSFLGNFNTDTVCNSNCNRLVLIRHLELTCNKLGASEYSRLGQNCKKGVESEAPIRLYLATRGCVE